VLHMLQMYDANRTFKGLAVLWCWLGNLSGHMLLTVVAKPPKDAPGRSRFDRWRPLARIGRSTAPITAMS
jgi:hypothetical protein